jgi:hypothetical protein
MPAVIAFSGDDEDVILVQEDAEQLAKELDHRSGFIRVTRLPSPRQGFEPMTAWVNPARVAFVTHASPSR